MWASCTLTGSAAHTCSVPRTVRRDVRVRDPERRVGTTSVPCRLRNAVSTVPSRGVIPLDKRSFGRGISRGRPVTLFTGQWADLSFEEICRKASNWGYDGLEIACWGDHMDVRKAAEDPKYVADRKSSSSDTAQLLGVERPPAGQCVAYLGRRLDSSRRGSQGNPEDTPVGH